MRNPLRTVACQFALALALKSLSVGAAAEEFKYYVWTDERGIVHAEEAPPKGVDYKVRIIEDVNANVVPADDFRPYGDLPAADGGTTGSETMRPDTDGNRDAGGPVPADEGTRP
jgi:hypothetical protein